MRLNLNLSDINIGYQNLLSQRTTNTLTIRNASKKAVPLNILQNCLDSLDLFKGLLEDMPHMKNRVIRDVSKAIQVETYNQDDVIYDVSDKSIAVYFCLSGSVSIKIPEDKTVRSNNIQNKTTEQQNKIVNWTQIDSLQTGQGFGQGQFVSQIKRSVRATAKTHETTIGMLYLQSVTQVIQNYKMRVYYKKRDMFLKCPLFQDLSPPKIQFIANNTKLMTAKISQKIVHEGQKTDFLYLVNTGKIQMWKNNCQQEHLAAQFSSMPSLYKLKQKKQLKRIMGGVIQGGGFLGDLQLVLNKNYQFTAVAITEKVQLYYCDIRIVLSQMRQQQLQNLREFYESRLNNLQNRKIRFNNISRQLQQKKQVDFLPILNRNQIKLKRKLLHRYYEDKQSLIGCSSPLDISKMIDRKKARFQHLYAQKNNNPVLQLFPSHSMKKKCSSKIMCFSPINAVHNPMHVKQSPIKKSYTQMSQKMNPEQEDDDSINKIKSMMIKMKHRPINLREIKHKPQDNLAVAAKVLGSYIKHSRLHSCYELIESINKCNV